jgi:hypothetical protein
MQPHISHALHCEVARGKQYLPYVPRWVGVQVSSAISLPGSFCRQWLSADYQSWRHRQKHERILIFWVTFYIAILCRYYSKTYLEARSPWCWTRLLEKWYFKRDQRTNHGVRFARVCRNKIEIQSFCCFVGMVLASSEQKSSLLDAWFARSAYHTIFILHSSPNHLWLVTAVCSFGLYRKN